MTLTDIEELLNEAADPLLRPHERQQLINYAKEKTAAYERDLRRNDFYNFFTFIRPDFQMNWHHKVLAEVVQRAESTPNGREMVHLPPRAGKSEQISVAGTAWVIGRHPEWKILQLCLNNRLAEEFGRKTRDIIDSDDYRQVFPDVRLHPSSRAVNSFATTSPGSKYLAVGSGSNIHGFGGDWIVVDDPVGDQDTGPAAQDKAYEWFQRGPRLRLQPEGRILGVMSRWPGNDFGARIQADAKSGRGEPYNVTKISAYALDEVGNPILDENDKKIWYWPERWRSEFMEQKERTMQPALWRSQFMQEDVPDDGASSIPQDRWRKWPLINGKLVLPAFEFVLQSWDTAFTEKTKNSASACTTWGIFYLPDQSKNVSNAFGQEYNAGSNVAQAMLLDAYKGYVEFPVLKRVALEQYRRYRPDEVWIEGRASGKPLMQDLRRIGLPLRDYTPVSGETKEVRLSAVSDLFASGYIWTLDYEIAEHQHLFEVIMQCLRGPGGADSDFVDSVSMALRRFKRGGFLKNKMDDSVEMPAPKKKKRLRREVIYG